MNKLALQESLYVLKEKRGNHEFLGLYKYQNGQLEALFRPRILGHRSLDAEINSFCYDIVKKFGYSFDDLLRKGIEDYENSDDHKGFPLDFSEPEDISGKVIVSDGEAVEYSPLSFEEQEIIFKKLNEIMSSNKRHVETIRG